MSNSRKIDIFMLTCLGILLYLLFVGCSYSKKTAKQVDNIELLKKQFEKKSEEDKAKYIAEYLKNNPCVFPEIDLDSLCEYWNTPYNMPFGDTIINNSTSTKVSIKKILVPYEDKRHIQLLKDSINEISTRERESKAVVVNLKEFIPIIVKETNKKGKWDVNGWFFICLGLFCFLVFSMYLNIKKLPK